MAEGINNRNNTRIVRQRQGLYFTGINIYRPA